MQMKEELSTQKVGGQLEPDSVIAAAQGPLAEVFGHNKPGKELGPISKEAMKTQQAPVQTKLIQVDSSFTHKEIVMKMEQKASVPGPVTGRVFPSCPFHQKQDATVQMDSSHWHQCWHRWAPQHLHLSTFLLRHRTQH